MKQILQKSTNIFGIIISIAQHKSERPSKNGLVRVQLKEKQDQINQNFFLLLFSSDSALKARNPSENWVPFSILFGNGTAP